MQHRRPPCSDAIKPGRDAKCRNRNTSRHDERPHSRGAICVRVMHQTVAPSTLRAQGMPGAGRTRRPCVLKRGRMHTSRQVEPKRSGTPCAMALRLTPRSPRCVGLSSHRRCANRFAQLDTSVEASGPRGLTVRIVPHVLRPNASIATRLTSGDEWPTRPPYRGGLASLNHNFRVSERRIFLRSWLDTISGVLPVVSPLQHFRPTQFRA